MKVIFLGTSAAMPTLKRNVPAIALYLESTGKFWLFDCGEGTQQQIKKSALKLSRLEKIFISHFHGDHVFGLPGMLSTRTLEGITSPVTVYGPEGIGEFIEANRRFTNFHLTYELKTVNLKEDSKAIVCEDDDFIVRSSVLKHSMRAYGFSVERKPRYRLMIEKIREAGIPEGREYASLKEGRTIKLKDGRVFNGKDFIEKMDDGRKITFCSDTTYCSNSVELSKGSDLLIHEATFSRNEAALAKRNMHSTVEDACRVASEAGVGALILTHLSPRYDTNREEEDIYNYNDLHEEAKSFFPGAKLAKDFMEYEIT